jgi:AcrR family transcriptional regulator
MVPVELTPRDVPQRVIDATVKLLADAGPSAIKARTVAAEAGMSTRVVYHHFGGVPELLLAVIDHGYVELERVFSATAVTEDPVADLFSLALATRDMAGMNPHLYDLMFGLSTRATYRPTSDSQSRRSGHSPAFQAAYRHLTDVCVRLVDSGRVDIREPGVVAAFMWSFVHGFISLELGGHFTNFDDPVTEVLTPMAVTFAVGLGDNGALAQASAEKALRSSRVDEVAERPDQGAVDGSHRSDR